MITPDTLRRFCASRGYFTVGDNAQYEKLFDLARNERSAHELALVIWLCSVTEETVEEIEHELLEYWWSVRSNAS
mgnify:CR=1 FL=1